MAASIVIAGGGLGGFQVATSLRDLGYAGRVTLICEEPALPYHRPPLSKGFLLGSVDEAHLAMRAASHYAEKRIDVLTGRRVVALDRTHRRAGMDDDSTIEYEHFVFATGARNRPLPVPGVDQRGVHYLRTLADAQALRGQIAPSRRAVVLGAGFIGLEFAAAAAKLGMQVTVLDVAHRAMVRAVSPAISAIVAREHRRAGVELRFGTQVLRVLGNDGAVNGVETVEGEVIAADLLLIGIGVQPNVEVAAAAGLEISNGIVVDAQLLTADPNVSALGDCAAHPNAFSDGASIRLESVQNATDQAKVIASRLTGKPMRYHSVPWFWSDQGELKLQIAGLTTGMDQTVMRGDSEGTSCAVFCFRAGRLLGVETVNRPGDHMLARKLVGQGIAITPQLAADESFDIKTLVAAPAAT